MSRIMRMARCGYCLMAVSLFFCCHAWAPPNKSLQRSRPPPPPPLAASLSANENQKTTTTTTTTSPPPFFISTITSNTNINNDLDHHSTSSSSSSSSSSDTSTTMATQISSASASSSSDKSNNNNNNNNNIDQGRLLEGGKVIDFGNVKASNTAEQALADARRQLLTATSTSASSSSSSSSSPHHHHQYSDDILGINQQVIEEVGHALGTFASATEIQECAAWLRSQATTTCLERNDDNNNNNNNNNFDASQITRYQAIIDQAYFEAGEVTGAFAKTFYMGTMLLPEASRRAIWAIYVWCRRTDEIVDAPRENEQDMLVDLSSWEMRLERLWAFGEVVDVYDLCLLDVRTQYPTLDITPFMDMIRGMLMDVPGLGQDRYDTFDQLHLYCYRVAGTVGIMSLPVFGCAEGFTDDIAREPALSLGVAFQLTNILRDVGEDAAQRGRVYLPQEDLERFGVTEDQIFEQRVDENFVKLMKFQIERARMYYERARRGVFMLAPESRLPVQSSLDAYGRILDKIEENGYDCLTRRAYVDKYEKLAIIPFSWYRTLDVSRMIPLPGDAPVDLTV